MPDRDLFAAAERPTCIVRPFKMQLLKWVGNKQRFAHEIVSYFPAEYGVYYEPFVGSGAVLGTLAPRAAVASDVCEPLIGIWRLVHDEPSTLVSEYAKRWERFQSDRQGTYDQVRASFNREHGPHDLFFLARTCYAGIIRFRTDGFMSTPIGPHQPVAPSSVAERVRVWQVRTAGTTFRCTDFQGTCEEAKEGDVVYCDPPYTDTQSILYGAQAFSLKRLLAVIAKLKARGVFVALSIDGKKKSGQRVCDVPIPEGLFETEVPVNCGRSMLRRLQMSGQTLEAEVVTDRLLLTWAV